MSSRDTKLYVGNLSPSATRGDLEKEFGYYGHLANVWVARNPPGFAYVEFEDARDAEDALRLDGRSVGGKRVRVEVAHGMRGGGRGGGGGGGRGGGWDNRDRDRDRGVRKGFNPNDRCYNCGERGHYAYDCSTYRSHRGGGKRSYSRSRSRSPRRRSRSRSGRRSRRRSYSRSKSRSASRSRSRSKSKSRSHSHSNSRARSKDRTNGKSHSRSRSRSNSRSRSRS